MTGVVWRTRGSVDAFRCVSRPYFAKTETIFLSHGELEIRTFVFFCNSLFTSFPRSERGELKAKIPFFPLCPTEIDLFAAKEDKLQPF